jgi:hypothetical protein
VNRWIRVCNSDTANIPIALMVFGLAVAAQSLATAVPVPLVWVFVGARSRAGGRSKERPDGRVLWATGPANRSVPKTGYTAGYRTYAR